MTTAAVDDAAWAEEVFGGCDLGDPRRTKRLVEYAGRQVASHMRGGCMKILAGYGLTAGCS